MGRGESLEGAWSGLTWQDEEDECREETEKAQQRDRKKTGECGVTEATGRSFTHSFIKPDFSRFRDYGSECKIPWLHDDSILGEK